MILKTDGDNLQIKIVDFGFGIRVRDEQNEPIWSQEVVGTPGYMAPEIVNLD